MNCSCAHGFMLCWTSFLLSFSLFTFRVYLLFVIEIETLVMIKKQINCPIDLIIVICSILDLILSMILAMFTILIMLSIRTEMRYGLGYISLNSLEIASDVIVYQKLVSPMKL